MRATTARPIRYRKTGPLPEATIILETEIIRAVITLPPVRRRKTGPVPEATITLGTETIREVTAPLPVTTIREPRMICVFRKTYRDKLNRGLRNLT
jgi:hypothetical protein